MRVWKEIIFIFLLGGCMTPDGFSLTTETSERALAACPDRTRQCLYEIAVNIQDDFSQRDDRAPDFNRSSRLLQTRN